jgi:hypothetical protein
LVVDCFVPSSVCGPSRRKAFVSTKAAKDISDDVNGLVGRYTVILVTIGDGLGGSVGIVSLCWEACGPRHVKNRQPGG